MPLRNYSLTIEQRQRSSQQRTGRLPNLDISFSRSTLRTKSWTVPSWFCNTAETSSARSNDSIVSVCVPESETNSMLLLTCQNESLDDGNQCCCWSIRNRNKETLWRDTITFSTTKYPDALNTHALIVLPLAELTLGNLYNFAWSTDRFWIFSENYYISCWSFAFT